MYRTAKAKPRIKVPKRQKIVRVRSERSSLVGQLINLIALIFAVANLVQSARIIITLNREIEIIFYAIELIAIVAAMVINVMERNYKYIMVALLIASYVVAQLIVFHINTVFDVNFNSGLSYFIFLSFLIFASKNFNLEKFLRQLYVVCCLYVAVYLIISIFFPQYFTNYNGVYDISYAFKIIGRDHYKDARVVMATAFVTYGIAYSFKSLISKFEFVHLFTFLLFAMAIFLADYRFYQAVIFAVLVFILLIKFQKYSKYVVAAAFTLGGLAMVVGVFDSHINVFSHFSSDDSGYARYVEYETAKDIVAKHPVLGLGIPSSPDDLNKHVNSAKTFFYEDLGAMGVWAGFGLIGFMLYLALGISSTLLDLRYRAPLTTGDVALLATAVYLCLYSTLAPTFWGGSGTMFAALIFALNLGRIKFLRN